MNEENARLDSDRNAAWSHGVVNANYIPEFFPNIEAINCVYTYGNRHHWQEIYRFFDQSITKLNGDVFKNHKGNKLECTLNVKHRGIIKFYIKVWISKFWDKKKPQNYSFSGNGYVFIIEPQRVSGDYFGFQQFKHEYIFKQWSPFILGLPKWALVLRNNEQEYREYLNNIHYKLKEYLRSIYIYIDYNAFLKPIFEDLLNDPWFV